MKGLSHHNCYYSEYKHSENGLISYKNHLAESLLIYGL